MSAIVALDPGTTTGVAWVWKHVPDYNVHLMLDGGKHGDAFEVEAKKPLTWHEELTAAHTIVDELEGVERLHGLAVVVYEGFTLRQFNMRADLLAPVRITAMVQAVAEEREVGLAAQWISQSPSSKGTLTRKRMEALNLWLPGKEHARDALRHLVLRLRRGAGGISPGHEQ